MLLETRSICTVAATGLADRLQPLTKGLFGRLRGNGAARGALRCDTGGDSGITY